MKALKSSDAQKAFVLKQGADGVPVAELCRKAASAQPAHRPYRKTTQSRGRPAFSNPE